ncbi:GNAT family N-acetyltransferase [Jannaschia sp. M317]|uniref:GNAT family N-acetyltransferase n=1 Tax=Jannaschia sp. M317 TaxID=2867011 RepID=UPI0021A2CE51|nr:GNAT family N-acetyltransferase [Jannaschia sp. M317]UWQ18931.1 GNAT family N-acetyltransferase [Jannaschia sp. M317]
MTDGPRLRQADPSDAAALAAFHVRIWRLTYRDLAPAAAYDALDIARRLPAWDALLASPAPDRGAVLAQGRDGIAGVVAFGPASQADLGATAEIKHLYVDPNARGAGLGRRLLDLALDRLARAGHARAALAVVTANNRARAFYARSGGVETERFTDAGPL